MTDRRLATLRATLGFLQLPPRAPELQLLHRWLDTWTGIGLIAVGLHRQGWDLQLTQYGDGNWRATFYVTGAAHSIVGGSAWEPTAWRAVQRHSSSAHYGQVEFPSEFAAASANSCGPVPSPFAQITNLPPGRM